MIINISGTGGAGKSHLVRTVMGLYDHRESIEFYGRKQPLYYILHNEESDRKLAVLGHYETACGGCDTLAKYPKTLDFVYDLLRRFHKPHVDILYEGMLLESDRNRVVAMKEEGHDIRVISINISLEECLESINIRRRIKNPDAGPVNSDATTRRHRQVQLRIPFLQKHGVDAGFYSRLEAYELTCSHLGITSQMLNDRWLP